MFNVIYLAWARQMCRSALCLCCLVLLTGCMAGGSSAGFSTYDEGSARKDLKAAIRLVEENRFHEVIPQLQHLISMYPDTAAAADAHFFLGKAYAGVGASQDAIARLTEYLVQTFHGKYAQEARTLRTELNAEYYGRYPGHHRLEEEIASLRAKLATEPDSREVLVQLADKLWKNGEYAEAGALYIQLVERYPELKKGRVLRERIEEQPGGRYLVLSPSKILQREIDRNPISVINTASFRSGRDLITRQPLYYVVTGQLLNRGEETVYGVEAHVTIYGFGTTVYDTATYRIGRLNAGETRAFSIRFTNFEDINSIDRYECIATYQ